MLRELVRRAVVSWMKQLDATQILFGQGSDGETVPLDEHLEASLPKLLECGGARRLLVMLPHNSTNMRPVEILTRQLNELPSLAENSDGDFVLCHEVEQISLTQVAVTLIEERRDWADYASRLHTRTDVSWSVLPDLV